MADRRRRVANQLAGVIFGAAVLVASHSVPGWSQASDQRPILRLATMDLKPYGFYGGGRPGIFSEIGLAIAQDAGFAAVNRVMPIKRMLRELEIGISDCGMFLRLPWSDERYEMVAEVIEAFESVIVMRKGLKIRRLSDLQGHALGWVRGSFPGHYVTESPEITRFATNSYRQSVELLKAGRVDAIAGTALSVFYNLDVAGFTKADVGDVMAFDWQPVWFQCARDKLSRGSRERLRAAVEHLVSKGEVERILSSYDVPDFEVVELAD